MPYQDLLENYLQEKSYGPVDDDEDPEATPEQQAQVQEARLQAHEEAKSW